MQTMQALLTLAKGATAPPLACPAEYGRIRDLVGKGGCCTGIIPKNLVKSNLIFLSNFLIFLLVINSAD
jgi:hypothetical protein